MFAPIIVASPQKAAHNVSDDEEPPWTTDNIFQGEANRPRPSQVRYAYSADGPYFLPPPKSSQSASSMKSSRSTSPTKSACLASPTKVSKGKVKASTPLPPNAHMRPSSPIESASSAIKPPSTVGTLKQPSTSKKREAAPSTSHVVNLRRREFYFTLTAS